MQILLPIVLGLLAFYFSKYIRLYATPLYLIAMMISSLAILNGTEHSYLLVNSGFLGLAFFLVVMFAGAFTKGSSLNRRLRSVRREYAILGFIFITAHAYYYIVDSILTVAPLEIFGLIAFLIIIPLTMISFQFVKRTIATSRWLKYQRFAYLVYVLIMVHLIVVAPSEHGVVYSFILGGYIFLKGKNYLFDEVPLTKATVLSIIVTSMSLVVVYDYEVTEYHVYDILDGNDLKDGTYSGKAIGYRNEDVNVVVTVFNSKITNIVLLDCGCTPNSSDGKYLAASYNVVNSIVTTNSIDVDAVAGATETSNAIKKAVFKALEKAVIN